MKIFRTGRFPHIDPASHIGKLSDDMKSHLNGVLDSFNADLSHAIHKLDLGEGSKEVNADEAIEGLKQAILLDLVIETAFAKMKTVPQLKRRVQALFELWNSLVEADASKKLLDIINTDHHKSSRDEPMPSRDPNCPCKPCTVGRILGLSEPVGQFLLNVEERKAFVDGKIVELAPATLAELQALLESGVQDGDCTAHDVEVCVIH